MTSDPITDAADATVRRAFLAGRLLVAAWLAYVLFQAVTTFDAYVPGRPWPFLLTTLRLWTFLPIHEAGHLFFRPFGTVAMFLGGSILQVLLPALWWALALRQRSALWPFALFWVGENIMDVSLYVRDAPVRALPLLGGHRSGHDWYNILSRWELLDAAETIADVLFLAGIVIAAAAIVASVLLAFAAYRRPPVPAIPD